MSIHKDQDKQIKVIAGKFENAEGPVKKHNVEPIYFDVELTKNKNFNFKLPKTHNSFIYLVDGEIEIGEKKHSGRSPLVPASSWLNHLLAFGAKASKDFGKHLNEFEIIQTRLKASVCIQAFKQV